MGSGPAAGFSKAKARIYMHAYLKITCIYSLRKCASFQPTGIWTNTRVGRVHTIALPFLNTITFQSGVTTTLKTESHLCNSLQALIFLFLVGYTQTPIVKVYNSGKLDVACSLPAICFVFFLNPPLFFFFLGKWGSGNYTRWHERSVSV